MSAKQFQITTPDGTPANTVVVDRQTGLAVQDIEQIDFEPLTPNTPLRGRVRYTSSVVEMADFSIGNLVIDALPRAVVERESAVAAGAAPARLTQPHHEYGEDRED